MSFIKDVVDGIAHIIHPDKPREWFANVKLPTDYTADEVAEMLDEAAAKNPAFKDWENSWVDLIKLSHPDNPDEAASMEKRTAMAEEAGEKNYTGTAEQNRRMHAYTFKAIQQRGIPMPQGN